MFERAAAFDQDLGWCVGSNVNLGKGVGVCLRRPLKWRVDGVARRRRDYTVRERRSGPRFPILSTARARRRRAASRAGPGTSAGPAPPRTRRMRCRRATCSFLYSRRSRHSCCAAARSSCSSAGRRCATAAWAATTRGSRCRARHEWPRSPRPCWSTRPNQRKLNTHITKYNNKTALAAAAATPQQSPRTPATARHRTRRRRSPRGPRYPDARTPSG